MEGRRGRGQRSQREEDRLHPLGNQGCGGGGVGAFIHEAPTVWGLHRCQPIGLANNPVRRYSATHFTDEAVAVVERKGLIRGHTAGEG